MTGTRAAARRSLVGDILTIQLAITCGITLIALAGLVWTSGLVVRNNLGTWAEQWATELNELGAPFYIRDNGEAVLDVERFVRKYPEIRSVTWYKPDGTVFTSLDKDGPVDANAAPLAATIIEELSAKVGQNPAFLLRQNLQGSRRYRLSGPVWVDSFGSDGVFETNRKNAKSRPKLLGFVAVNLDFSAYQSAFLDRLAPACAALIALILGSWLVARLLVKRALQPLSELQQPLADIAEGKMDVAFPAPRHKETDAIVTALEDTLLALQQREQHLMHLANHDSLTGLFTRHRLVSELEAEIDSCEQKRMRSALCFVDLDQFKYINDTCGHPAGDKMLRLAADQLRAAVRSEDVVARFGGDEFCILLRDVSRTEARTIASEVLTQMGSLSHVEKGHVFHLQCSVGIAPITSSRFGSHELIAQADMACQSAKANGRNRVEIYNVSAKQSERMIQDVHWMRNIRQALENNSFRLHYQPLMHIPTGRISHYEALLRLQTDRGLVGPQTFLPAAARFGFMSEIDTWVVEHAIKALAQFSQGGSNLRLSVNLSSLAFENQAFAATVRSLLKEHNLSGDRICFEITEQMAVRFAVQLDRQLTTLRDLGCRIAVDDFGTGYSSFSYLKKLPVDYLKIDGSFIRKLTSSRVDQTMVRMIGEVAKAAGLQTVAEYVESAGALRLLAKYGIDYAQGYYIGRAVPEPLEAVFNPESVAAGV
jgi:diguanylate cyclase (GGDEF)-like protein